MVWYESAVIMVVRGCLIPNPFPGQHCQGFPSLKVGLERNIEAKGNIMVSRKKGTHHPLLSRLKIQSDVEVGP